jgi:hypothetical protein
MRVARSCSAPLSPGSCFQDEDPAGAAVMSGLLIFINVGIVVLFIIQCFLTWQYPPPPVQPYRRPVLNPTDRGFVVAEKVSTEDPSEHSQS